MSGYAGTGTLLRLALRRDRILLPLCVVGLVALAGGSAKTTVDLYQGPAAVEAARGLLASPAIVALYGPVANPDNPDSFAIFKTLLLGAIAMAIVCIVLVRRHTRTEEDAGRTELVGAGTVGRKAPLAVAVILGAGTAVLSSALAAASLVGAHLGASGSIAFGVAWAGVGLVFTAVTAVAAQLASTTRGTAAIAFGVLGASYALRAVGDTVGGAGWLVWLSPLGWAEKVEAFGTDRFWVGLLPLAATLALLGVADTLLDRRDLGAGVLPARPGPARAAASLDSPVALAWRLQRGLLFGWAVGYLALGLVLGGVAGSVATIASSPQMQEVLRSLGGEAPSLSDAFVVTELQFLAAGAAAYGIAAALRLRTEESDLHTEQVLATPTTRRRWLAAHSVIALGGSALLMVVLALALGVGSGSAVGRVLPSALATIPAIWVCVGLALAFFGSAPRVVYLAWGLLAAFVLVGMFTDLLNLPSAVADLSPFTHVLVLPGSTVPALPLLVLLAVVAGLWLTASGTFRRRDLVS